MHHTPGNSEKRIKNKEEGEKKEKEKNATETETDEKEEEQTLRSNRIGLECLVIGMMVIQYQHFLNHLVMYVVRNVSIVYFYRKVD